MKNLKHTNRTKSSLEWKRVLHTKKRFFVEPKMILLWSCCKSFTFKNVFDVPYFLLAKKNIIEFNALLFSKYVYESQLNASKRGSSVCVHCCCPLHCFILSHPFIHCLFSVSPWFPRSDWRRWWGAICFSWRMLLTQRHSGDNQPPTHIHTYVHRIQHAVQWIVSLHFPIIPGSSRKYPIWPFLPLNICFHFFLLLPGEAISSFRNLHLRAPKPLFSCQLSSYDPFHWVRRPVLRWPSHTEPRGLTYRPCPEIASIPWVSSE